jgi:hypothetical protein
MDFLCSEHEPSAISMTAALASRPWGWPDPATVGLSEGEGSALPCPASCCDVGVVGDSAGAGVC